MAFQGIHQPALKKRYGDCRKVDGFKRIEIRISAKQISTRSLGGPHLPKGSRIIEGAVAI